MQRPPPLNNRVARSNYIAHLGPYTATCTAMGISGAERSCGGLLHALQYGKQGRGHRKVSGVKKISQYHTQTVITFYSL